MHTGAQSTVAALRRQIERLETPGERFAADEREDSVGLSLGIEAIDALLPPGGGVHQFAPASSGDSMAAHGFVSALLARAMSRAPREEALIIREPGAMRELGPSYPPGLHAMGADPDRLIFISPPSPAAALRIADDALKSGAVKLVMLELWDGAALADLNITRRFNLSAVPAGAVILLSTPNLGATSAALTRWRVASRPSSGRRGMLGRPAFETTLARNRQGGVASWRLGWDVDEQAFAPAEPMAAPVVRPPLHRSHPARPPAPDGALRPYRQTG